MSLWELVAITYIALGLISLGMMLERWGKPKKDKPIGWFDLAAWVIGMIIVLIIMFRI